MVAPKVGFIIQARLNSSRLKGKILLPLPYGTPTTLLEQIILRAKAVSNNATIILATSVNPENKVLSEIALATNVVFFTGSEDNVLERFYQATTQYKLDIIVRLTADNPFIDPAVIHSALQDHITYNYDYTLTQGLPVGANVEIISYPALRKSYQEAVLAEHQEHVTPYIQLNKNLFKVNLINFKDDAYGQENWRLTVDNENDYALACLLYAQVATAPIPFSLRQTAAFIYANPWVLLINKNNYQKKIFSSVAEEIKEAITLLKNNDFPNAAHLLEQQI